MTTRAYIAAQKAHEQAITDSRLSVTRYVVTHVNRDGDRTLFDSQRGQYTYATSEEAQARCDAFLKNRANLASAIPNPDSLAVRPCDCWPGHFDPKRIWFDKAYEAA